MTMEHQPLEDVYRTTWISQKSWVCKRYLDPFLNMAMDGVSMLVFVGVYISYLVVIFQLTMIVCWRVRAEMNHMFLVLSFVNFVF